MNALINGIPLFMLTGVVALVDMDSALAQSAPGKSRTVATSGAIDTNEGLEEIVVTATRRETSLERTPISISALSAADIQENRVVSMSDVTRLSPSLVYIDRSPAETYLSLRGAVILDDSPGSDPAVSMFVDDVVRVSVADLQPELFDMDRVEVLRGPQGTLFGRNSIGGVVSIYTKQPTFENAGSAELTYGEHNLVEVKGMLNTPLVADKLAARLVFSTTSVGGDVRDITTGRELDSQHRWAFRGKLLFLPTDDFKLVTTLDYLHVNSTEFTWIVGNFKPTLFPNLTFDPQQTAQLTPGQGSQQNWGGTIRADWQTRIGTATSITGYRHLDVRDLKSLTGAPIDLVLSHTDEHDTQFTEELRLASPVDQRFSWIAGVYFLHSNRFRPLPASLGYLPEMFLAQIAAFPSPVAYQTFQRTHTDSAAPFGNLTVAFNEKLKVDLGGRYTWQSKSGYGQIDPSNVFSGPPASATYSASWTAFTPALTVTYQPSQALMTYATASKGFLSGGFNAQGSTSLALGNPFDSEYVWNYEIGEKFHGLDNRLQLNISAFTDRYTNLQVIQSDRRTAAIDTTNAGAAKVDGIETDLSVAPLPWLTLGVKYDHLHARFTKYVIDNGDGTFTSYTGKKVPFTPSDRVTASFETHTKLWNDSGSVALGGDYTHRSSQEFTIGNDIPQDIRTLTEWRGVVNLHASWTSRSDKWQVSLWGKNITDQHYAVFAQDDTIFYTTPAEFANSPPNHIFEVQPGPYRSFGITLRSNF